MTTCVLCGGEIPSGWPIVALPRGPAHRFKTMCDELEAPQAQACGLLEAHGQHLGFDFGLEEAAARAGSLILEDPEKAA